ncbi:MAG: hypothetical protein LBV49_02935 [Azonexus sp.]|jgi:hypothetical protein|nr:hypothetical protein [Azonexus sp.]
MDLLQIIKLVSIPGWVKYLSLAIISACIALAVYAIFGGAHLAEGSVLQAGMGLLGILLPLAIAIIFLSFYEAGVSPLKKATEKILMELIPGTLSHIQAADGKEGRAQVAPMYIPEHRCRYLIKLPDDKLMRLEVELNVKKVSIIFYFCPDMPLGLPDIRKNMGHTLDGAEKEKYEINAVLFHKAWDGVDYHCLALYKMLPSDFLWNSAEKLYFAQDLQVMLNSALREAGDLLALGEK